MKWKSIFLFLCLFVAVAGKDVAKDIIGVLATWAHLNFIPADSRQVGKTSKEDLGSAPSHRHYVHTRFVWFKNTICDGQAPTIVTDVRYTIILVADKWLLPPAYVVRREGNVLTCVCPSICLSTGGAVPISHNALQHFPECHGADGGGTLPGPAGGVPCWGYPARGGYPAGGGYPAMGVTLLGVPCGGVPRYGTPPPSQVRMGGTQLGQQKE